MMIMTAKVDFKKFILILAGTAALVLAAILLLGGGESEQPPAAATANVSSNEGRLQFLKNFGWDAAASPTESGQVKIPSDSNEVFERYNILQKGQGYDLTAYAGKNVMRYVYKINNCPGATAPVYATLLIHKDQVIGGDITDTSPGGKIRGFKMPDSAHTPDISSPEESAAAEQP